MRVAALKNGAINFLTKPLDEKELFIAVNEALDKSAELIRIHLELKEVSTLINSLTHRQYQIFQLLTKGMLNKQIAAELNIREHTVKLHSGMITEKFGVMGMIGLLILIFVFGMQPADPPLEVMLIILSVVTAATALQAAGGMDYLVSVAAKILRSRPGQITFLGPLVTYFFTLFAGTAHISYSIMPIIAEVATKARIRPERAMSMSVTAAHMGITASPVSAASAALLPKFTLSEGLSPVLH